jgi:hypothetical protein
MSAIDTLVFVAILLGLFSTLREIQDLKKRIKNLESRNFIRATGESPSTDVYTAERSGK